MIITIDDIRSAGYCVSGARRWFDLHGLNFADFLKNGIDAELFVERGDELAAKVVEKKRVRDGQE